MAAGAGTTPGQALKALRHMAGMTLKEVAFAAETSIAYLSRVENGSAAPAQEYVAKVTMTIAARMLATPQKRAAR
jgi:transcriptional regulator with XRE-family HTH domain